MLYVRQQLTSEVKDRAAETERRAKAIQQKLDRLDEAYLFAQTIDLKSYERQRDKLREELTLAQIDHHAESIEELDVQGILAFAERVLPRASDVWVLASLNQKQRLQQLFLPEGIAFDGNRFSRTAATAPFFKYLAPGERAEERMASLTFARWNRIGEWFRRLEGLRCSVNPQGRSAGVRRVTEIRRPPTPCGRHPPDRERASRGQRRYRRDVDSES